MKIKTLVIMMVMLLVSCNNVKNDSRSGTVGDNDAYISKIIKIKSTKLNEEHYFFSSKEIRIYFPYAIDFIKIKKVSLLSKGAVVSQLSDTSKISNKEKNKLILHVDQEINHFDSIDILDSNNNSIFLDTGDIYYDGSIYSEDIPQDKEIFLRTQYSKISKGNFYLKVDFSTIEGASIAFSLPKPFEKVAIHVTQKIIKKKKNTTTYEFSFDIPHQYYKQHNLTDLSFELKADEIYKGKRKTIYTSFIPMNISETK